MNAELYIRKHIRKILSEQEKKKEKNSKPKIRSVGVGGGGWKGRIQDAGALAKDDPGLLMKNLKVVKRKQTGSELDILQDYLEQATSETEEMSNVYDLNLNPPKTKDKDGNVLDSIVIDSKIIPARDAQKYMEHTIVGITNAFNLKWNKEIEITRSGNKIVVYLK